MPNPGRRVLACFALFGVAWRFGGLLFAAPRAPPAAKPSVHVNVADSQAFALDVPGRERNTDINIWFGASWRFLCYGLGVAACVRGVAALAHGRREAAMGGVSSDTDVDAVGRRVVLLPAALAAASVGAEATLAKDVPVSELPPKISADPYELIGMTKPDDRKADQEEFFMKKKYKEDTQQVLKHMKISGSLDKGAPNMEKWNKRVKEEMNDWLALYRRQDSVVGRQSYFALYGAINTLASHFTSYGPKFPLPNKRRGNFYGDINQTEKYLEKGK